MGLVITPESALGQELAKWEQFDSRYGPPGHPYRYEEYPRMLYRAQKRTDGKVLCMDMPPSQYACVDDNAYRRASEAAEAFTKSCQRIVHSDTERSRAEAEGWRITPELALDYHEALEQAIGNAAAEAAFAAKRMSAQARAEFTAAQDDTHEHVADLVPVKTGPRKSRAVNADEE